MLMRKKDLMDKYAIYEGAKVVSLDEENLGKITSMNDDSFTVEKGFFFPKDFTARYDDIRDFRDGIVYLNQNKDDLMEWRNESYAGWSQTQDINEGRLQAEPLEQYRDQYRERFSDRVKDQFKDRFQSRDTSQLNQDTSRLNPEETRIPIVEEELQAQKIVREAGQVQVRKIVHTEFKHFTVPVMREEVRVERVPVTDKEAGSRLSEADKAFNERVINVPVMEEEVTISKRPVVKEEVRVTKERQTEQREVSGEVRKEDVNIQEEGVAKKRKAG